MPLLSGLGAQDMAVFERHTKLCRFQKGEIIIQQSDYGNALYIIHQGSVNVTHENVDGKEVIISVLRVGDHFGEVALLDDEPRSATVSAREACEVSAIRKGDFEILLKTIPALVANMNRALCQRLRQADELIEMLALSNVSGRVVRLLQSLAQPIDNQMVVIERLTHREIAARVGSSREMVSRIIRALVDADRVEVSADRKIILKPSLLQTIG